MYQNTDRLAMIVFDMIDWDSFTDRDWELFEPSHYVYHLCEKLEIADQGAVYQRVFDLYDAHCMATAN